MRKSRFLSGLLSLAIAISSTGFPGIITASAAGDAKSFNFTAQPKDGALNMTEVVEYSPEKGYGFLSKTTSTAMVERTLDMAAITKDDNGFSITQTTDQGGMAFAADMNGAGLYRITVEALDGSDKSNTIVAVNGMQGSRLMGSSPWDDAGNVAKTGKAVWTGNTWSYDYVAPSGHIEVEIEPAAASGGTVGVKSIEIVPLEKTSSRQKPGIFFLGDSTVKEYTFAESPMSGWGQILDDMFDSEKVQVANYAQGGRSFKSMYQEGRFNDLLLAGQPGDYVLIQSGHNDDSDDKTDRFGRGSTAETYKAWMTDYFIPSVKAMGMTPIFVTPMTRIRGDKTGGSEVVFSGFTDIPFPEIMKTTAAEQNVACIDLYTKSKEYMNSIGGDAVKAMFMAIEPGEAAGALSRQSSYANGHPDKKIDGTHFKEAMAKQFARIIAGELAGMDTIKDYLTAPVTAAAASGDWSQIMPELTADVSTGENAYYRNQVEKLVQTGIMGRDADGNFLPEQTMTVGEFAQMMTNMWALPAGTLSDYLENITPIGDGISYENGVLSVKGEGTAVLLHASYQNGSLTGISWESITMPYENTIAAELGDKFMVWNSLSAMEPVYAAYEVAAPSVQLMAVGDAANNIWTASAQDPLTAESVLADTDKGTLSLVGDLSYYDQDGGQPVNATVGDRTFTAYLSHASINGGWDNNSGGIRTGYTTLLKFVPKSDGVVTAYLLNVGATKHACILKDGTTDFKNPGTANGSLVYTLGTGDMSVSANLKANETYYIFVDGSKGRFAAVDFEPGAAYVPDTPENTPKPEITPVPEKPDPGTTLEWTVNAAEYGCEIGTTLMYGLTTLFKDAGSPGKYLTSGSDAVFDKITGTITGGTALKFIAPENGTLSVSLSGLGAGKGAYIIKEGVSSLDDAVTSFTNPSATDKVDTTLTAEVEADATYYIAGRGTKARFTSAKFVSKTDTPEPDEPDFVERTPIDADEALTKEAMAAILYDAYLAKFGRTGDELNKTAYMTNYENPAKNAQFAPLTDWSALKDKGSISSRFFGKVKAAYTLGLIRADKGIARGTLANATELEPGMMITRAKAAKELFFCYTLGQDPKLPNDGYSRGGITPPAIQTPKPTPTPTPSTGLPENILWRADDAAFDQTAALTAPVTVNDLTIGTDLNLATVSEGATYTHTDGKEYTFNRAWKGGGGDAANLKRALSFMPKGDCVVTVVFDGTGAAGRNQYIYQNGEILAEGVSDTEKTKPQAITATITDLTNPVITYGGGSNKNVYAIFVEHVEPESQADYEKTWSFSDYDSLEALTADGVLTEGSNLYLDTAKGYLQGNSGTLQIPADPAVIHEGKSGVISVSYCYEANFDIEGKKNYEDHSSSTDYIETAQFVYSADEVTKDGYVTVNVKGMTYLTAVSRATRNLKTLTGTVTNSSGKDLSGSKLTFTNEQTGNVVSIPYTENYSVELPNSFYYAVGVSEPADVCSTLDTRDVRVFRTENPPHNVELVAIKPMTVVGDIVGLTSEELAKVTLTFTGTENAGGTAAIDPQAKTLSLTLMPNDNYTVTATGAEGFSLSKLSVSYRMEAGVKNPYKNILFTPIPKETEYPADGILRVGEQQEYKTVNEAMTAIRSMKNRGTQRITVEIDPGVYREQVIVDQNYVTFRAADPENPPVLTWYYGVQYSYYSCHDGFYDQDYAVAKIEKGTPDRWGCSVRVQGSNFLAENIDFESSFNLYMTQEEIDDGAVPPEKSALIPRDNLNIDVRAKDGATERAAALAVEGNQAELYRCSMTSSQDTLYTGSPNAYFKECAIQGNTDYIFGGNSIVFEDCRLVWGGYSDKTTGGYISACKTSSPNDNGYLFVNCTVENGSPSFTYGENGQLNGTLQFAPGAFGRNWGGQDCNVYFLDTRLNGVQKPNGWVEMGGALSLSKLFVEGVYDISDTAKGTDLTAAGDNPNGKAAAMPQISDFLGTWVPIHYTGSVPELTEYTTNYFFAKNDGAPEINLEGKTGTVTGITNAPTEQVIQVDATSGKLNNINNPDWAQFNKGTILHVPVVNGSVISVKCYTGNSFTIDGKAYTTEGTYTYSGSAEYVDVVSGNGYIRTITVVSPVNPEEASGLDCRFDLTGQSATHSILTADEVTNKTQATFGLTKDGTRVAADSADAAAVFTNFKYHSEEHGLNPGTITVAVDGPTQITYGTCAYGGVVTIKNSSDETVATLNINTGKCYHGNKAENIISFTYGGKADTLTLSGGSYISYVAFKSVDVISYNVTYQCDDAAAEGTVPAMQNAVSGTQITIPKNQTLYKEGYTLTGWTDGETVYPVDTTMTVTKEVTLKPVFTQNADNALAGATVNFDFQVKNGAPIFNLQGKTGIYVCQATGGAAPVDVCLRIDATGGKVANGNWSDWCQMNPGTKFIIPVQTGSTVVMGGLYNAEQAFTVNGQSFSKTGDTYTHTGAAGTVELITQGNGYWRGFSVTYPAA